MDRLALGVAAAALALGACALPARLPVEAMPAAESDTCPRLRPVQRVWPRYPRAALDAHQDGWVLVEFDLPRDGVPRNVRIFLSSPPDIFDEASMRAVAKFRYPTGNDYRNCLADVVFTMR
jgi:TonB family protein